MHTLKYLTYTSSYTKRELLNELSYQELLLLQATLKSSQLGLQYIDCLL